jgi:glycogen phosphorylase
MNDFKVIWMLPVALLGLGVLLMSRSKKPPVDESEVEPNPDGNQDHHKPEISASQDKLADESIADLGNELLMEADRSSTPLDAGTTADRKHNDSHNNSKTMSEMTNKPLSGKTSRELSEETSSELLASQPSERLEDVEPTDLNVKAAADSELEVEVETGTDLTSEVEVAAEPEVAPAVSSATLPSKMASKMAPKTPILKLPPIGDRTSFQMATFQQAFTEALSQQGQSLSAVPPQTGYTILAAMVQEQLQSLRTFDPQTDQRTDQRTSEQTNQRTDQRTDQQIQAQRITVQVAIDAFLDLPLESHLVNLGILESVRQALSQLDVNLQALLALEASFQSLGDRFPQTIGDSLEALTTAQLPAIGYALRQDIRTDAAPWEIKCQHKVNVPLGGYTQLYTETDGRLRVRWTPQEVITGIPYDTLISGYAANTVSPLRRWQIVSLDQDRKDLGKDLEKDLEKDSEKDLRTIEPSNAENWLKQHFFLAACVVADIMRFQQQSGEPIEALPRQFAIHLHSAATGLTIVELMRWLIDEFDLEWQIAWNLTQQTCSCRLYDGTQTVGDRWSIAVLERLLPRHLEIIYEINRRFLDELKADGIENINRIRQLSLIDEDGDRTLRVQHLICLGCRTISVATLSSTQRSTQTRSLIAPSDSFSDRLKAKMRQHPTGINARRFLLQANPSLAALITQWIGESWIANPKDLKQLEELVQNRQFCAEWWQVRRTLKQNLIRLIQHQADVSINMNSLIDVQAAPIGILSRQLLNLLHIITLYIRLKVNSSTDTIQHFTHRSVPRSCFFVGQSLSHDPMAASILYLMRSVATTINNDPDVQGKLQVVVLDNYSEQTLRALYAAADVVESLARADQSLLSMTNLAFALNGALTIGTLTPGNLELQQAVGGKNCFLFGMTATASNTLDSQGYKPSSYYSRNPDLKQAIDAIASGYFSFGDTSAFQSLGNWLFTQDSSLVLADYEAYMDCQERVSQHYQDQKNWTWMSILTTARMELLSDRVNYSCCHYS